jgi:hypothetical protein
LAGEVDVLGPGDWVFHAAGLPEVYQLLQRTSLALIAAPAAGNGLAC